MHTTSSSHVLSSSTISGDKVVNRQGEDLGDIKDLMIDVDSGRVAYAVLEFGGFLGLGSKLFAVPLSAMELDSENRTATKNGTTNALASVSGDFIELDPGEASIEYSDATVGGPTATLEVKWRDRWV